MASSAALSTSRSHPHSQQESISPRADGSTRGVSSPRPRPGDETAPASRMPRTDASPSPGGDDNDDIPVETLVEHLLAAKRSLSSMTLVLRANNLATQGRHLHEESVILSAQAAFVRRGVEDQVRLLHRMRRRMNRVQESGRREFKNLLRTLDGANARLETTMNLLRKTMVKAVYRPEGEEQKCLMDFVDESSVEGMRNAIKEGISELQKAQSSFNMDLDRFDADLAHLQQMLDAQPLEQASLSASKASLSIPDLLASLSASSHAMAENLTALTRHFDMCVTAVRTTEGGAALARRKAAEDTQSRGGDPVSISGVISEEEMQLAELAPISPEDRAEICKVVVRDAPEAFEVVVELEGALHQMETDFLVLKGQADHVRRGFLSALELFHLLEEVGGRLGNYAAAENEYYQRWECEKDAIFARMEEMEELREFYQGYTSAYDSMGLEHQRRRSVEAKIQSAWRKARETVVRLIEADRREREAFRQEVGEYLPTDLWVGMNRPLRNWVMVPAKEAAADTALRDSPTCGEVGFLHADQNVVEATKGTSRRSSSAR